MARLCVVGVPSRGRAEDGWTQCGAPAVDGLPCCREHAAEDLRSLAAWLDETSELARALVDGLGDILGLRELTNAALASSEMLRRKLEELRSANINPLKPKAEVGKEEKEPRHE